MNNHADIYEIQIFEFPIFRYINLFYSIPISLIPMIAIIRLVGDSEICILPDFPLLNLFLVTFFGLILCSISIKTFFGLSVQKAKVFVFRRGFKLKVGLRQIVVLWEDVKSVSFPKDKYESRSRSSASKAMFYFGRIHFLSISCSTWAIFRKTKREQYNQAFEDFKAVVRQVCASKINNM